MKNIKKESFINVIKDQFIKHTDACVEDFLKGDIKSLFGNLKQLSKVVYDNFKPMIPKKFHELWQHGIETNAYYLKLRSEERRVGKECRSWWVWAKYMTNILIQQRVD